MPILGFYTAKEVQAQIDAAIKASFQPFERWQLETASAEKFNLPDPGIYANQADLFRKLSWVLQAVDITAGAGALTPFSVARVIANKEPKDIPNHPFEMLLNNPNPMDSRFEFLFATIALWMLNGNAYWWLNRVDEFSPPEEMWFIPPHMIKPVPDKRLYLKGYIYYPGNGQEIPLLPHEIVHFRRFNPFSRFVGLSAIESIALVSQGDLGMQEWNTRLFKENNARLPGILAFKQYVADPTWDDIKAQTREASKKRELMMLRGVGEGGVEWMQNAVSQKEMEFLAGRAFNRDEIFNTLAPGLVSMLSESATEANSRTGRAVFNELTVYPKHVLMNEKITNDILPAYPGRPLLGRFEDIRVTDRQLALQEQEKYAQTHTVEEIRQEYYGDEPLGDDRDKLFPSQINAQSGGIQKPPPSPFGNPKDKPELERAENKPPQEPEEKDQAAKSRETLEALQKYERYALTKIGKPLKFSNDALPDHLVRSIALEVSDCKDVAAVKAVFGRHKAIYAAAPVKMSDAAAVLEGLRLALESTR